MDSAIPVCDCHNVPKYWDTWKGYKNGGAWRCAVRREASRNAFRQRLTTIQQATLYHYRRRAELRKIKIKELYDIN